MHSTASAPKSAIQYLRRLGARLGFRHFRDESHVSAGEALAAMTAVDHGFTLVSAIHVEGAEPIGSFPGKPSLAIRVERHHHIEEVLPHLGEPVLVAERPLLVGDRFEQPDLHQAVKAVGQRVPSDAEALDEGVEAADPQEGVAEDEHRPGVAQQLDGVGDRALEVGKGPARHICSVVSFRLQLAILADIV